MSVSVGDGVLGLEALWRWESNGTPAALTLNDLQNDVPGAPAVLPRLKLISIGRAGVESEIEADDLLGRIGQEGHPTFPGSRTLPLTGEIQARSLQELRQYENALRGAFAPGVRGRMRVFPRIEYGDVEWYLDGEAASLPDIVDEQTYRPQHQPTAFARPFVLSLRGFDPRFYHSLEQNIAGASGVDDDAMNAGNSDTDPRFLIYTLGGPVSLLNDTYGRELRFVGLPINEYFTIDFKARTAVRNSDGSDIVAPYMDFDNSDWWDPGIAGMRPGLNTLRVTGANWTYFWRNAAW